MKKALSIILSIILIFSVFAVNTNAETGKTSDIEGIILALNAVEPVSEQMGLSDIDFEALTYADAVMAYDYTGEGLVFNSEFIPVKYGEVLMGWVIKKLSDGEPFYQFTTAFAEQADEIDKKGREFAVIYAYDASYLYDGEELYPLGSVSIPVEGRCILESAEQLENAEITLRSIEGTYELPYGNPGLNGRAQVYFSCNVARVTQNPYENLCWAASIACIVNYIKETNYTTVSVAKDWRGELMDKGLDSAEEIQVLKKYGISYTYKYSAPSANVMLTNIQEGDPIYVSFKHMKGRHAGVIYGVNIMAGYFYVMDPIDGFCNGSYSSANVYMYVSPSTGLAMILDQASCKYWE